MQMSKFLKLVKKLQRIKTIRIWIIAKQNQSFYINLEKKR